MSAAPKTRIICVDDSKETRDLFDLLLDDESDVLKDGNFQALVAALARVAAGERVRPRGGLRF